jgi:hypothetical protein
VARRGARGRGPGGLDVVLGLPDLARSAVAVLGSGGVGLTELSSELDPERWGRGPGAAPVAAALERVPAGERRPRRHGAARSVRPPQRVPGGCTPHCATARAPFVVTGVAALT